MPQILVVDDSSTVRNKVSSFLIDHGFTVQQADDGSDALVKLKNDPSFKLVISDINMPHLDGLSMCEAIRNDLKNHSIHLLMLTTESDEQMKRRGRAMGVKGWMLKPFNGNAALSTIKALVGK